MSKQLNGQKTIGDESFKFGPLFILRNDTGRDWEPINMLTCPTNFYSLTVSVFLQTSQYEAELRYQIIRNRGGKKYAGRKLSAISFGKMTSFPTLFSVCHQSYFVTRHNNRYQ
jgi:hypothetical protein